MKKLKLIPVAGFIGAIFLASCEKPEPIYTDPKVVTLDDNLYGFAPEPESFNVDASKSFSVKTKNGAIVSFPSNAFTFNGKAVVGNVELSVQEISSKADIVLSDVPTMSDEGPLESWGEFLVTASQNNNELSLATGKTFSINTTIATPNASAVGWQNNAGGNIDTSAFWSQNNLNQSGNNPCDLVYYYSDLLESIEVGSEPEKVSKYLNGITQILQGYLLKEGYSGSFNFVMDSDSMSVYEWTTENEFYQATTNAWQQMSFYGNNKETWDVNDTTITAHKAGSTLVVINGCVITINSVSLNLDPNTLSITFNELGWCNIDALISQYGASYDCTIKIKNVPRGANVKFVFPDLNAALSAKGVKEGEFTIDRLPTGMSIQVIVYYMKEKKLYFGTQLITADEDMTFDEVNIKELPSLTELVKKIKEEIK